MKQWTCKAYKWLSTIWSGHLERPDQPMVRAVLAVQSDCMYCTAWRMFVLGSGITSVLVGYGTVFLPLGIAAIAAIAAGVWAERNACNEGDKDVD